MNFQPRGERLRLPKGWRDGRDEAIVRSVLVVERYSSRGLFVLSKPDEKGYVWCRLCIGHPYANKYGWQRLHRYLMMRVLGRRLEWYEHVHHEGDDKTTTDIRRLSLTMADDHGRLHYARRLTRGGRHVPLWLPRETGTGRFTKYPTDESMNDNVDSHTSNVLASEVPF